MEVQHDLLDEFSAAKKKNSYFIPAIILYTLHNILSLISFFVSLRNSHILINILVSSPIIVMQLFLVRVLPLVALGLFIFRKKPGWFLVLVFSILDILYKGMFAISVIMNSRPYMQAAPYLTAGLLVTLLLSFFITWLVLLPSTSAVFEISNNTKVITIVTGIIIFLLLKFYLVDQITRLARRH